MAAPVLVFVERMEVLEIAVGFVHEAPDGIVVLVDIVFAQSLVRRLVEEVFAGCKGQDGKKPDCKKQFIYRFHVFQDLK